MPSPPYACGSTFHKNKRLESHPLVCPGFLLTLISSNQIAKGLPTTVTKGENKLRQQSTPDSLIVSANQATLCLHQVINCENTAIE